MAEGHRQIDGLDYRVEDGVAYLTLNRPEKLNAITRDMYLGIRLYVLDAEFDDAVELVVLSAVGDEAFCPGGDLSQGSDRFASPDVSTEQAKLEGSFPYFAFERVDKLILAAVNGLTQATGVIAVLMSDLVIASDRATFKVPEPLVGMADPFIPARLWRNVGLAKARWLMYTQAEIDAHEAERIGLVGKVVPHDQLRQAVEETVSQIKKTSPAARTAYKRMLHDNLGPVPLDRFLQHMRHPEALEGMTSFKEQRPPSWQTKDGGTPAANLEERR